MMSGHGTIDNAVEATRIGAMAFLEKPIALQKLLRAVEQGLSKPAPKAQQDVALSALVPSPPEPPPLIAEQSFTLDRPLREARDDFERAYFEFHLAREGGSMTRVADKTGLERTHLYRKLKQLGVDWGRTGRKNQGANLSPPVDDGRSE
jgi:DNA-binding NtrC family response regulator